MDFYDYATTHDLSRRAGLTNDTPADFYRQVQAAAYVERARGVKGMAVEFNRYQSELNWSIAGRPYYKLWPAIIPLLAGALPKKSKTCPDRRTLALGWQRQIMPLNERTIPS